MDEAHAEAIERAARDLLDALDRMYGRDVLSLNVMDKRDALRALVPRHVDERDLARQSA